MPQILRVDSRGIVRKEVGGAEGQTQGVLSLHAPSGMIMCLIV